MTSVEFHAAVDSFGHTGGYLAAASIGIPPKQAVAALTADLDAWWRADRDPQGYDGVIDRTRSLYAGMVGVLPDRVAQGSQTSVLASLVAAAVPAGAEVLTVDGDFSSIVFPFLNSGARVRTVALEALADSITDETWLVVFSLVQSATGVVAAVPAILEAAARHNAFTFCDTTQAVGVLPVNAGLFDATVCHSYKWLCSPRGVAFLTLSERFERLLTPVQAGWYAGGDVWQSCYGPNMALASSARRFDVSPAWQAWIGAEQSIGLFAGLNIQELWAHASALGDALCDAVGIAPKHQAIVSWPDASGDAAARLAAAGIRASSRAGKVRAAFHLWNTEADVAATVAALRR
jgi:selenocysteine lyase/cysteine desulfurase